MADTTQRNSVIVTLVESGYDRPQIDEALASLGQGILTDEEAVEHGIALPDAITADDLLTTDAPAPVEQAPKVDKVQASPKKQPAQKKQSTPTVTEGIPDDAPQEVKDAAHAYIKEISAKAKGPVNLGNLMGMNAVAEKPIFAANMAIIQMTVQVASVLKQLDPEAWKHYKSMKSPGTWEAKQAAYVWAFTHLMKLGYQPNG